MVPSNLLHCAGEQGLQAMVQSSKHESSSLFTLLYDLTLCAMLFCFSPFILHYNYHISHPVYFFFYLSWLLLVLSHWNGPKELLKGKSPTISEKNAILHVNLERNIYNNRYSRTPQSNTSNLGEVKGKLQKCLYITL